MERAAVTTGDPGGTSCGRVCGTPLHLNNATSNTSSIIIAIIIREVVKKNEYFTVRLTVRGGGGQPPWP